ncbi:hypothetical protein [Cellvibrio mixtus]|uniref:hypothetical protein n=1 Tax=Cellvibrio mixtus TaxID=39650 RepID=UPI000586D78D|nr:hypothetical protein [Cellvibrio mixtus]
MQLIKMMVTLFLVMGAIWTLLPWAVGVNNYVKSHSGYLTAIARSYWLLLLVLHPLLIYLLWLIRKKEQYENCSF